MQQAERFELLVGRKETSAFPWSLSERSGENIPAVPVLPETLLKMELEVRQSSTDLREFSDAVLGDVGATIQILRMAGQEYGSVADRPVRVEDCISDLGPRACIHAVAKGALVRGIRQQSIAEIWVHSREVAQYFRLFAANGPSGINPDQAYLAGLLHALGSLPAILDWNNHRVPIDPAKAALAMAERWNFPRFLSDFFGEVFMPGHRPQWSSFITVAHHAAKESWLECPLGRRTSTRIALGR